MYIETLYDQYYQQWYGVLNTYPKLKYYSSFKTRICEENYLNYIKCDKYRVALTRLTCSAHNLAIEEGRFRKIDRDDRKCLLCQMNVVESEYHFTLVCPCYREIRIQCLPKYYCHWPPLQKFQSLMSSPYKHTLNKLQVGNYVYLANLKRDNILNESM